MEGSMIFKENCSQEGHRCQTQLCAYIILACGTKDMYQDTKQAYKQVVFIVFTWHVSFEEKDFSC